MNAVEFIKQYGWEEAKSTVNFFSGIFHKLDENENVIFTFQIDDLKQLVDAWELIQKRGSLSEAKAIEQQYWNSGVGAAMMVAMVLKQAIELVESVNENN